MRRNFTTTIGLPLIALILTFSSLHVFSDNMLPEGRSEYPFTEDFEGQDFPPAGWSLYSLLNNSQNWDQHPWLNHTPGGAHSAFHDYSSEFMMDNWLVTPQISMPTEGYYYLTFWSWLANNWAYKKSSVLVSTGSSNPADGDYVEVWALTETNNAWAWYQQFINLQAYAGQNIYIAFRYEGDPWGHNWYVDDISLGEEIDDSPVLNLSTSQITHFSGLNGTGSKSITIMNGGILELTFDLEIEYLGAEGWLSANPFGGSIGTHSSADVLLNFDAAGLTFGSYQANLNISSNDPVNPTATVLVTLEVIDTNVYPLTEDFESEDFPPIGWTRYDQDGDETGWALSYVNHTPGGEFSAIHSYSWINQDGWLVMPQISVPEEGFYYLTFWSQVLDYEYYVNGRNSVLISPASGNPNDGDFTEVWTVEEVTGAWTQYFINIEEYAGQDIYIAFRYEGENAHNWVIDDVSVGEEIDDSPVLSVSQLEVALTVGENGSGLRSFRVMNDGILNLTFDIEVEFLTADAWLIANPLSGSIPAKSNQTISLDFDAAGLELGSYHANINITSNDPVNPTATVVVTLNVMESQQVDLTVINPQYTFPTAISSDGMYVSGSEFGGFNSYLWKKLSGTIGFAGDAQGVSDLGVVAGTYDTEFQFNGLDVNTAGTWQSTTSQWQFLGMNPEVPEFFDAFYNSAYGITADGNTIVGMQWYPDWTVKAFRWTQDGGYDMIGAGITSNSRANGISANGSVIYGWAEPNWTRTPVIWHNGEIIYIDQTQYGEAFGASAGGHYVTGNIGQSGFIWSPTLGVTFFDNSLNSGSLSPQHVLDNGTVFGYTAEGFPPLPPGRRAFVRHPNGHMETFNEYAAGRGWFEVSDWIFFSINDVTPDGNKFIGAAELPTGEWISFIADFNPGNPVIVVNPMQLNEMLAEGLTSTQVMAIENAGTGLLTYDLLIQYTSAKSKVQKVPEGINYKSGKLAFDSKKVNGRGGIKAEKTGTTLNYDGENADAIGLISGGTFYGAARFPSELTSIFENYKIESVDVYINDVPTILKLTIWNAGTTTSPGAILHQQTFVPTSASWNTITLDNPLTISGSDIWVGFEVVHNAGLFILGVDGNPSVPDGNWISQDALNWEHLSDYEINGNWNIRANISYNGMNWLSVSPKSGLLSEGMVQDITASFNTEGLEIGSYTANLRITSNDAENPLVIVPVTLQVVLVNFVDEPEVVQVNLFPNPASTYVQVLAGEQIDRISIIDMSGKVVSMEKVSNLSAVLDLSGLNSGMYIIQVITNQGLFNQRLQIHK